MDLPKLPPLLMAPKKNPPLIRWKPKFQTALPVVVRGVVSVGIIGLISVLVGVNCMNLSRPVSLENLLTSRCVVHSSSDTTTPKNILGTESAKIISEDEIKSVALWNTIVKEHPKYRDGWVQLSYVYFKEGNLPKAQEAFDQVIKLDPVGTSVEESIKKLEQLLQ